MKERFCQILVLLLVFIFISCTKQHDRSFNSIIVTGIKSTKGNELESIMVDSGVISSVPVDCYALGSTVFDPISGGYGFINCDSIFKLVNPETGEVLKSVKLPGYFTQAVITGEDNTLIGMLTTLSYKDVLDSAGNVIPGYGEPIYTNYVIKVNLSNGTIASQKQIDLPDGTVVCSHYYDTNTKGYVLLGGDLKLISFNPATGAIIKTVNIGKPLSNMIYNPDNKTVIGISAYSNPDRLYIEAFDSETGSLVSSKEIDKLKSLCLCISGYDPESGCYLGINDQYEVIFIEVSTGTIKKTYKLQDPMNDIKFWRK